MITAEFATHFAKDWIESWNAHDLERILTHYTDDFEMTTPLIVTVMNVPSGTLQGKAQIRDYWQKGLARRPHLKFNLQKVTYGVDTLAIHFDSETGRNSVEWFFFNNEGKVQKSLAHHDEILIAN
jgi:SnoaL-like domain